jgi:hypothetical protein
MKISSTLLPYFSNSLASLVTHQGRELADLAGPDNVDVSRATAVA